MPDNKPRGERLFRIFICHGCQSCWRAYQEGSPVVGDHYPHFISKPEDVTDLYVKKPDLPK